MKIKRRALEVVLSDGETKVTVHAPSMEQFTDYIESFAIMQKIGQAFQAAAQSNGVMNMTAVKMDKSLMDGFYPLLAALSDITVEEFKALPVEDGMAIMLAYVKLLSPESLSNPTQAEPVTVPQPAASQS